MRPDRESWWHEPVESRERFRTIHLVETDREDVPGTRGSALCSASVGGWFRMVDRLIVALSPGGKLAWVTMA